MLHQIRGAGTSERQGGKLFQRALSKLYVQSLPPTLLSNTVVRTTFLNLFVR